MDTFNVIALKILWGIILFTLVVGTISGFVSYFRWHNKQEQKRKERAEETKRKLANGEYAEDFSKSFEERARAYYAHKAKLEQEAQEAEPDDDSESSNS